MIATASATEPTPSTAFKTKQVTFAANTTEALSRWAGEVLETLGSERDRAQALHHENARVSREATMAQKEILGLEAKVFHAKKDVRMNVDDTRTGRMQYVSATHNS